MADEPDDYEVGYARPPLHSRFSSDHQPVRRGRKKGAKGLRSTLRQVLKERLPVIRKDGSRGSDLPLPILLRALVKAGATGNVKGASVLIELVLRAFGFDDDDSAAVASISNADEQIIADFVERFAADQIAAAAAIEDNSDGCLASEGGQDNV